MKQSNNISTSSGASGGRTSCRKQRVPLNNRLCDTLGRWSAVCCPPGSCFTSQQWESTGGGWDTGQSGSKRQVTGAPPAGQKHRAGWILTFLFFHKLPQSLQMKAWLTFSTRSDTNTAFVLVAAGNYKLWSAASNKLPLSTNCRRASVWCSGPVSFHFLFRAKTSSEVMFIYHLWFIRKHCEQKHKKDQEK